jgi:RNA polymerase sigma factor (sigma-70 family)
MGSDETSTDGRNFVTWVSSNRARLHAHARHLCPDPSTGEDLVQETLLRMFLAWPRLQHPAAINAYANRVLRNCWHDRHRRGFAREHPTAVDNLVDHLDPAAADPATHYCDQVAVPQILQLLPQARRRVLVLRLLLGYDIAETAELLGCSTGTVKSHTSRALATLRHHLNGT